MVHRRRLLEQQHARPSLARTTSRLVPHGALGPRSLDVGLGRICSSLGPSRTYRPAGTCALGLRGEHFANAANHVALRVVKREELKTVA